jgi:hypothetical protein
MRDKTRKEVDAIPSRLHGNEKSPSALNVMSATEQ